MPDRAHPAPARLAVMLGFGLVYIIWGSTYLAIRVAVETIPPFLMAGIRYITAGAMLYTWLRWRGIAPPLRVHWRTTAIIGGLMLLGGNGGVVWAEQPGKVPSGIAALMVSAVPLWMILFNWLRPRGVRPSAVEAFGLILGFLGVVILIDPGSISGSEPIDRGGAVALLLAPMFWAVGSIYSRHARLPDSAFLATGMEMLMGGALLVVAGTITGEWGRVSLEAISTKSILAFAYLVVFGALIGFTAYIWILRVSTPAKVGTYAYVNPAIAVLLGWLLLAEPISSSTLIAMAVILTGVILITTRATATQTQSANADDKSPAPPVDVPVAAAKHGEISCRSRPGSFSIREVIDRCRQSGRPYLEFMRSDSLSMGVYALPAGGVDPQQTHTEDEVYYVISGRAVLRVGEREQPVEAGAIEIVRAGVEHRFHDIAEDIVVLVLFAPAEGSLALATEERSPAACGD